MAAAAFSIGACGSKPKQEESQQKESQQKEQPQSIVEPADMSKPEAQLKDKAHVESKSEEKPFGSKEEPAESSKQRHAHWTYEGVLGPEVWGDIDPEYVLCKEGKMQSPIDLVWQRPSPGGAIQFDYLASRVGLINTGKTLEVYFQSGSEVSLRGKSHELLAMSFHSPSEHTISGRKYPLEMQLLHRGKDGGGLAVVSVLFVEGQAHPEIDRIWAQIPQHKNQPLEFTDFVIDVKSLIPPKLTYYHYKGSLTTPPCAEGVDWNVLNTPIEVSVEQIEAFRSLYGNNHRPVQPKNNRDVTNY